MQRRNDVTDMELAVLRPLNAYADALRAARPSPALDARIAALIRDSSRRPESSGARFRRLTAGVAAAAVLIAAFVLWSVRSERGEEPINERHNARLSVVEPLREHVDSAQLQDAHAAFSVLPTGQYSLWPTEASLLRVRARLGATATLAPDGEVTDERRFWVDVRIANDGSMRIVRVVPADSEWAVEKEE
jgi:hypothetical protein